MYAEEPRVSEEDLTYVAHLFEETDILTSLLLCILIMLKRFIEKDRSLLNHKALT